jgi:hypothetical protein
MRNLISGSCADEVRTLGQSKDRQGARPRSAADAARARRRSDRIKRRAFITPSLSKGRSRAKLRAELEQRDPERRAGLRRLALLWQINEPL